MAVAQARTPERRLDVSLWYAVMAGPAAWIFEHEANVILTPWVCRTGAHWVLLPIAVAALALAASGGLAAARHFRAAPPEQIEKGPAPESRRLFMAGAGLFLSALFFLGVAALAVPVVLSPPCR